MIHIHNYVLCVRMSSCTDLNWPVNYHMMFDIIAIICIGIVIVSLFLPKSIEKKREEEKS